MLPGLRVHVPQGRPEAEGAIADCRLGRGRTVCLEARQQAPPVVGIPAVTLRPLPSLDRRQRRPTGEEPISPKSTQKRVETARITPYQNVLITRAI